MTLHELMHELSNRDIRLSVRLVADAPKGGITDGLREALAAHKPHLLARLGRDLQWEALNPKGDLSEANDDAPDPYAVAERVAIQGEPLTPDDELAAFLRSIKHEQEARQLESRDPHERIVMCKP